jgi:YfiH family protein
VTLDPRGSTNRLPAPGAGFVWEPLPVVDEAWFLKPQTDVVLAAYTTRQGGVSNGPLAKLNVSTTQEGRYGDNPLRVIANRDLASRAIGRRGFGWATVHQVHGSRVVEAPRPGPRIDADAMWTDEPDRTLAVVSADCVLLLCVGPGRFAVAHAGWRGAVAGVIENTVREVYATDVFAGPAIGPCCFEVGPEVIDAFRRTYPDAIADERHVDLWRAAEIAATQAGATSFHAARICTSCNPELFFSHRRDHGLTGRQALLATLA